MKPETSHWWLVDSEGKVVGPYDLAALQAWAQAGQLARDTQVHRPDTQQWVAAGDAPELAECFAVSAGETGAAQETGGARSVAPALTEPVAAEPAATMAGRAFGAEDAPAEWAVGDVILNLYEVKGELGRGGMGLVYRVHHRGWNTDLAVKCPLPDSIAKAGGMESFIAEAETWVNLGLHPHTVSCHYVRKIGELPRVFVEVIEGGSLHDWIAKGRLYEGTIEEQLPRILDIAIQFAWGLGFAHDKNLIHQDVKPQNVMMTPEGVAKVTDFGLAKGRAAGGERAQRPAGLTIEASWGGMTEAYCSPEQAALYARRKDGLSADDLPKLTRRTDLWSWAVSVLEMFRGGVSWTSGSIAGDCFEQYLQTPNEAFKLPMPQGVVALLRQCFQENPDARPKDFGEVAAALRAVHREVMGEDYARSEPQAAELAAASLNNQALSLVDLGKLEAAEQLWAAALQADGHHPESTYNRGLVRWRAGRLSDTELVQQMEEVRTSHGDEWRDEYLLGLVHLERGDWEAAVKTLTEAAQGGGDVEAQTVLAKAKELQARHPQRPRAFEGYTDRVNSVAFSPDGKLALSGSHDKTVRLWETATGRCLRAFEGHTLEVTSVAFSPDGQRALSGSNDHTVRLWELVWDYEFPAATDWDDGARPWLEIFLTLHTPPAAPLPEGRDPTAEELILALTRRGKPSWTDADFQQLLEKLADAGYGWLRPEGVRRKLEKMAAGWSGPPPVC